MGKYLRIFSYIRKPFIIYDFATAPLWISWNIRKNLFSFFYQCGLSSLLGDPWGPNTLHPPSLIHFLCSETFKAWHSSQAFYTHYYRPLLGDPWGLSTTFTVFIFFPFTQVRRPAGPVTLGCPSPPSSFLALRFCMTWISWIKLVTLHFKSFQDTKDTQTQPKI